MDDQRPDVLDPVLGPLDRLRRREDAGVLLTDQEAALLDLARRVEALELSQAASEGVPD